MKKANIASLKDQLSRYLDYVRAGGTVRVFDRQRPIAEIVPLDERARPATALTAVLADLERQGILRRGRGDAREFLRRRLPRAGRSVVAALLEDRREGR
jgi:antitoxin (DNA-binding transcriptional repressor) of toxin-antitoxin stability system